MYSSQKLLLETYFDLSLALMVTLYEYSKDVSVFWNPFQTKYDRIDSIVTVIVLAMLIALILYGSLGVKTNFEDIKHGKIPTYLEFYLEDVSTKTRYSAQYTTFFLIRRIAMTIVLVTARIHPYSQMAFLMTLSFINIQYLI